MTRNVSRIWEDSIVVRYSQVCLHPKHLVHKYLVVLNDSLAATAVFLALPKSTNPLAGERHQGRSLLSGVLAGCVSADGSAPIQTSWKARKDLQEGQKPCQRSLVVCSRLPLRIESKEPLSGLQSGVGQNVRAFRVLGGGFESGTMNIPLKNHNVEPLCKGRELVWISICGTVASGEVQTSRDPIAF